MIEIVDWKDEGITCPVISCDYCGEQITGTGNVLWIEPDKLIFCHKRCDRFDKAQRYLSRELDEFLSQLVNNYKAEPIPRETKDPSGTSARVSSATR